MCSVDSIIVTIISGIAQGILVELDLFVPSSYRTVVGSEAS